ncbi:MAG: putative LPS assembly protein LptD [Saprospiraceae bacterium]
MGSKFWIWIVRCWIFSPLGQYANLKVTGEVYFKNRWGLNLNSSYKKKYKFNGSATLNYASFAEEVGDGALEERKAFSFRWNHQQDPNAHPTMNFSGNVDISTNNFNRALRNDANNVLNNTLNSNLNYSYRPKDKPFNFTAGFDHSQNNLSRQITFNFQI